MDKGALHPEDRMNSMSASMNPKLGTEGGGHPVHTNNVTGIIASQYISEGSRDWKIKI